MRDPLEAFCRSGVEGREADGAAKLQALQGLQYDHVGGAIWGSADHGLEFIHRKILGSQTEPWKRRAITHVSGESITRSRS
jgi:hypothetical protein